MKVCIPPPRHYESVYGSSEAVHAYLIQIETQVAAAFQPETIDTLRISLLIAHPDELANGLFLEYEKFAWKSGFVAVGINGNFKQYHRGDDLEKIRVLSEMLQRAFTQIAKKKKANLDGKLMNEIVTQTTQSFQEHFKRI